MSEVTETFTGTGTSAELKITESCFNVSRFGGVGTVRLERSFDEGVTWLAVHTMTTDYEGVGKEIDKLVRYRFNCTAYTSGNIFVRISSGRI